MGERPRLRDLGVCIGREAPGPNNAITDVPGVRVGHRSIVRGEGRLAPGRGPVRTGVTVIHPGEGDPYFDRPAAGAFVLNGAGEVTGLSQLREWGCLESPIGLTNTFSVPAVTEGILDWMLDRHPSIGRETDVAIPVVGECDDSWLNDIAGRHIGAGLVRDCLDAAAGGPVPEGNVGAGTGTVTLGLKGGIGTSSRRLGAADGDYTIGVLVQSNFGRLEDMRLNGMPIGPWLAERMRHHEHRRRDYGSIIIVVATDAPLSPHQLERVARRAALGVARTGSHGAHASGELVVAFSTETRFPRLTQARTVSVRQLHDAWLDPVFRATVDATEEAVLNALCAGEAMIGANDHRVEALPLDAVREYLAAMRPPPLAGLEDPPA